MSRDSITRLLKEFETDGIIAVKGKEITILSFDKLREIALKG